MASSSVCPPIVGEPGLLPMEPSQPVCVTVEVTSPSLTPIPEDGVTVDCGAASPVAGNLLICNTGTSMRPYRCKQCRQRFRALNHLQEHSRLHSGHRPYACPLCSRAYRQQSQLHVHLRSHGQDSSLRCGRCKVALPHMAALASHTLHQHGRAASSQLSTPRPCKRSFDKTADLAAGGSSDDPWNNQEILGQVENLLAHALQGSPTFASDPVTEVSCKEPDECEPVCCSEWKRDSNSNMALVLYEPVAGPPDSEQASMSPCLHRHSPSASPSSSQLLQNHPQKSRSLVSPVSMESVDEMPDDLSHHGDELLHRDPPDNLSRHGDDDRPRSARLNSFDSDEPPSLERMSPAAVCKSPPHLTKMASSYEGKLSRLTQSLGCSSSPKVNSISPQYLACSSAREEASSIGNGSPPSDMELGKPSSSTGQYSDYSDLGQASPASELETGKVAPRNHFSRFMDVEASPRSDADVSKPSTPHNHGSSSGHPSPDRDCVKVEYPTMGMGGNPDLLVTPREAQPRPSSPHVKTEPEDRDCNQSCEEQAMEVVPSQIKEEASEVAESSTEVLDPQPGPSGQFDEPTPCPTSSGSFFSEFAKFVSQLEQKGVSDISPVPLASTTPKSPIRIKILPPRPPPGSSVSSDPQRNIFTILQATPPPEATLFTMEGEDVYNLRPKRRRSLDPMADLHPENKYGSKKMPNARRLQQQMTRVEHLRQRICVLLQVLFPALPYPQRFVDTAPSVELLMDQVIAAAQDQDVENLMPGRLNTEPRVMLCKTPRKCLHALRRKVVQLLQVLLPGITSSESSGKQVEELLENVIASNSASVK